MMILEGGAAVQSALKMKGINAEYKRVTQNDLVEVFDGIEKLIQALLSKGLITEEPKFNLGSTSLAYRLFKKKKNQVVDDIDDPVLTKAEQHRIKTGFGDIDIDITIPTDKEPKETMEQIQREIETLFNKEGLPVVTYKGPTDSKTEISVGIPVGNGPSFYIQLDFLPIQSDEERNALRYWKGSSPVDEGEGVKGLFHTALGSALSRMIKPNDLIVKSAKVLGKTPEAFEQELKTKLDFGVKEKLAAVPVKKGIHTELDGKEYVCVGKKGDYVSLVSLDGTEKKDKIPADSVKPLYDANMIVVFSTTQDALILRGSIKLKGQKTATAIPLQDAPIAEFSLSKPDSLAQVLLGPGASGEDLLSSIKIAQYINKNWDKEKAKELWDIFRNADRTFDNKGTEEKAGSCTHDEYVHGMTKIGQAMGMDKYLGKDFNIFPDGYSADGVPQETPDNKMLKEYAYFEEGDSIHKGITKKSSDEFLDVLKALYPYVKDDGILKANEAPNIDLVEKMDSSFCHFGINKDNKFFLASSNSGDATEENFEDIFKNSMDFLESFRFLKDHKLLQVVLKNIKKETGKPVKFESEIFPVLTHQPDESGDITFVATKYSKDKLGNKGQFVIFKAQLFENDGWSYPSLSAQKKLMSDILDADSQDWKLLSNDVHMKVSQNLNFGVDFKQLDNYLGTDEGFENLKLLLGPGSKATPEKKRVKEILKTFKERIEGTNSAISQLADSLPSNLGKDYMEGLILRIKSDNGEVTEVKGLTQKFEQSKDRLFEFRNNEGRFGQLLKGIERDMKDKVLQLSMHSDRAVSAVMVQVVKELKANDVPKEDLLNQFFVSLWHKIHKSKADFTDVTRTGKSIASQYKKDLIQTKRDWKEKRETFDANSFRKTQADVEIKISKIEGHIAVLLSEQETDFGYVVNCFTHLFGNMAKNILTYLEPSNSVKTTKCALWVGRAQPWHVGHDNMIKVGLKNADTVFVVLVRGKQSSQDKETNPLDFQTQKELIKSLYPSDKVIVSDESPPSADLSDLMPLLYNKNMEAVAWLQGEDRADSYEGLFSYFKYPEWKQTHDYIPIKPSIKFVVTPRVASATDAREAAKSMEFIEWLNKFAPSNVNQTARVIYKKAYDQIRGPEINKDNQTKIQELFTGVNLQEGEGFSINRTKGDIYDFFKDRGEKTPLDYELFNKLNAKGFKHIDTHYEEAGTVEELLIKVESEIDKRKQTQIIVKLDTPKKQDTVALFFEFEPEDKTIGKNVCLVGFLKNKSGSIKNAEYGILHRKKTGEGKSQHSDLPPAIQNAFGALDGKWLEKSEVVKGLMVSINEKIQDEQTKKSLEEIIKACLGMSNQNKFILDNKLHTFVVDELGEILAPLALTSGTFIKNKQPLEILQQMLQIEDIQNPNKIYFPKKNNPLIDSYIDYSNRKVIKISSKGGKKGASASFVSVIMQIEQMENEANEKGISLPKEISDIKNNKLFILMDTYRKTNHPNGKKSSTAYAPVDFSERHNKVSGVDYTKLKEIIGSTPINAFSSETLVDIKKCADATCEWFNNTEVGGGITNLIRTILEKTNFIQMHFITNSEKDKLIINEFKLTYPPRFSGDISMSSEKIIDKGRLNGHIVFTFD